MNNRLFTIVISTAFQDAGDATRAIEIAKALKKYQPEGVDARIVFISHGSKFEQKVKELGFEVHQAEPKLPGVGLYQDLGMTITNLVGTEELAEELIKGEVKAYEEIKPDVVLHGFWPIAGLARRMMDEEIPGICFVPLPLVPDFFDVIPDVPEQIKVLAALPKAVRLRILHCIPSFAKRRIPILRQNNIRKAVYQLGWQGEKLVNVFDLLKADLMLVNDLPDYYNQSHFPTQVVFTGPLFAVPDNKEDVDLEIKEVFDAQNGKPKIFCTLSSAGSAEMLREVIKTFTFGKGLDWNAVILAPHFPLGEAKKLLSKRDGVYVTDKFIPAFTVNAMADVTVSHGGQGTVQTAIHSGTPIVGVAAQQEQFINLSNIESRGAGIRIPRAKWSAEVIQEAIEKILADGSYKEAMLNLRECALRIDGAQNAAKAIWDKIRQLTFGGM